MKRGFKWDLGSAKDMIPVYLNRLSSIIVLYRLEELDIYRILVSQKNTVLTFSCCSKNVREMLGHNNIRSYLVCDVLF